MKWRVVSLYLFFALFFAGIAARLFYWQVVVGADLSDQASNQRQSVSQTVGLRGNLLTSDGLGLAINKEVYRLFTNPKSANWTYEQVQALLTLLSASDAAKLTDRLSRKDLQWVALAQSVDQGVKAKIEKMGLSGVGFDLNPIRTYPEGSMSAHLTGFVGQDASGKPKGYFGLEGYYDRTLSGRSGRLVEERDALGRPIVIGNQSKLDEIDGENLTTSIDQALQYIIYQRLQAGLEKYQAAGGTVTVMDPKTGHILAIASLPNYDPSKYWEFDPVLYRNPVVADTYEPGSTFKVFVMAAALDAKVVTPETICDMCDRPAQVAGYTIRTWDDKYHPGSNMTDVLVHSDNIGMVFVSQKLGKDKFLAYLDKFGFGHKTDIDLQEETTGVIHRSSDFKDIDLATASFGQGIGVTAIQMIRAVGAIANLGELPSPRLVPAKSIRNSRIISTSAAAAITKMMVTSVDNGEAKWAKPAGFSIAGKTGTAQIPVAGHYDKEKTIASFVGFAPASNPVFVMLVTLNEPKSSPWGSETAAPLWFDISREIYRYYKI